MTSQPASHESFSRLTLPDRLVGESSAMIGLKSLARAIPPQQSTVLILGETGTGKESLARFIHQHSLRADRPFIPVDCSSLSDVHLESELFGCVKGAFDGATRDSLGFIRAADGGSVFLDAIGDLALPLQARLFHVLMEKTVLPVGDSNPHPVDVRIMAATNGDLEAMVQQGKFLSHLFRALNEVILKIPTLRDRPKDILPLAQHFLDVQAQLHHEPSRSISDRVAAVLQAYSWPGNVRELANLMEQAHVLASGDTLELGDIPLRLQNLHTQREQPIASLSLEDLERHTIATALKRCNYNRARAGRMLGINIQRLKRRIDHFGLQTTPLAAID